MTAAGTGHPDWQSYANWRGTLATVPATHYHTGSTVIGTFITTNYASVYVSADGTSGSGLLTLQWYADEAATMPTEQVTFPVDGITAFNVLTPASGNAVRVSINNDLAPDVIFAFILLPMNIPVAKTVFHVDPWDTGELNRVVGASGSVTENITQIMGGLAHLYFDPQLGSGKMSFQLFSINEDGAQDLRLCNFTNLTVPSQQLVVLPSRPLQVVIANSDAVNGHSISWALVTTGQ